MMKYSTYTWDLMQKKLHQLSHEKGIQEKTCSNFVNRTLRIGITIQQAEMINFT